MNNPNSESPEIMGVMIEKGYSSVILPKLEKILSSKTLSKETELIYVLLKCRALMLLGRYYDAAGLLDEYWEELQKLGTSMQKIDAFTFKAELLGIFGKEKECTIETFRLQCDLLRSVPHRKTRWTLRRTERNTEKNCESHRNESD